MIYSLPKTLRSVFGPHWLFFYDKAQVYIIQRDYGLSIHQSHSWDIRFLMPGKKKALICCLLALPHELQCVLCTTSVSGSLLTKQMFDRHRDNSFKICSSCGQHSDKRPCISTATQPRPYATWLNCPWRHCLASSSKWQTPLYGRRKNRSFVRRQFAFPLGSNFETLYFFFPLLNCFWEVFIMWSLHASKHGLLLPLPTLSALAWRQLSSVGTQIFPEVHGVEWPF